MDSSVKGDAYREEDQEAGLETGSNEISPGAFEERGSHPYGRGMDAGVDIQIWSSGWSLRRSQHR